LLAMCIQTTTSRSKSKPAFLAFTKTTHVAYGTCGITLEVPIHI
jgi:hypothetical protein